MEIRPPKNEAEIDRMWALNHRIFAEELHQHALHGDHRLVDRFHSQNHYIIAVENDDLLGMVCVHFDAPYSVTEKFGALMDPYIQPGKTAEIRLFTLIPERRKTTLAIRMIAEIFRMIIAHGAEYIVISGVSSQHQFYEHAGFKTLGEPVQSGESLFYPMVGHVPTLVKSNKSRSRYHV